MSAGGPLSQPIPVARSILWAPAPGGGGPRPANIPFPVFLSQAALTAIYEHVAASPARSGQGTLGFLLGDLCECPDTNVSYLVVDAALRLNQTIYGDRTRDLVTRLWDKIEAQLEEQQAHLIGWYHTHPPLPLALSPDDLETHEYYFAEPWQVALLVGTDPEEPAGALFRAGGDEASGATPLPFYELLAEESIRPGGKKRSFVTWKNYRAYNPVMPQPTPRGLTRPEPEAEPEPEPELEPEFAESEPEPEAEPEAEPEPEPTPPPPRREEKTSELKFLTTAEDFAAPVAPPPPPSSQPRSRAAPPPPAPPPVTPAAEEESAAPEWPAEYEEGGEAVAEEYAEPPAPPPPPPPPKPRKRRRRRSWRGLWRTLIGLVLIGGAAGAYWWFQPKLPPLKVPQAVKDLPTRVVSWVKTLPFLKRRPAPSKAPPRPTPARPAPARAPAQAASPQPVTPPPPSPYAKLDAIGDEVTLVTQSFNARAADFGRGQLACAGLARALATVEQRWTAYTNARSAVGVLDAARAARDQTLYAGVDAAERRFDKSGCERQ